MISRLSQHPVLYISQGHCIVRSSKWKPGYQRKAKINPRDTVTDDVDILLMKEALKEARQVLRSVSGRQDFRGAYISGEVPVGAVLVCDNEIISRSGNRTEQTNDPTAHAEIICIRSATARNNGWRLNDCILYTTLEPCPMCAGAILQSRLKRVVYGTRSPLLGAAGSWIDMFDRSNAHPFHSNTEIVNGICESECSQLLKEFYRERRIQSPKNGPCA